MFANQYQFNDPKSFDAARGGLSKNGGIVQPEQGHIPITMRLVRFGGYSAYDKANGTQPGKDPRLGRWWLDEEHYKRIAEQALGYGVPIPWMVREMCAVLEEWSDMTILFSAFVTQPLACYYGWGAPASRNGKEEYDGRMAKDLRIVQYFIPGLDDPGLFKEALLPSPTQYIPASFSVMPYVPKNPVP